MSWADLFQKATFQPAANPSLGQGRTILSPGEIAPADLVANEVRYILSQDAILDAIFEGRFQRKYWLEARDQATFGQLPLCAVYLVRNTNSEQPTSVAVEWTSVVVGTCWAPSVLGPVDDGEATIATVDAHIKRVLRATGNRELNVTYNGLNVPLAMDMSIGADGYGPLRDLEGRLFGVVNEIEAQYLLHVDRTTGQLVNLPPN